MREVVKYGDDIDAAVELALIDLKATRDEVEIELLEEPSRGFFGIGSKLAKVKVTLREPEPAEPEVVISEEPAVEETVVETVFEETVEVEKTTEAEESTDTFSEKPARKNRSRKRNRKKDKKEKKEEQPRNPKLDELDFHKTMGPLPEVEEHPAMTFLEEVVDKMGLDVNMKTKADAENVYVEISGPDSGTIIGKRGQTLDAIQYLTSLVVNKNTDNYIKVVVDAENYRTKRERTLEQLAHKLAGKVVRTRKVVKLEPMNPYERKVIHATLQDHPEVTTRSEGADPYRRVIIELK
jgi:spoIIIJ-associated protein